MPKPWGAPPEKPERPRLSMGEGLRELAAAIRYASQPRFVDLGRGYLDARRVEGIEDGRLATRGGRLIEVGATAPQLHKMIMEALDAE